MLRAIEFKLYNFSKWWAGRKLVNTSEQHFSKFNIESKRLRELAGVTTQERPTGNVLWFHTRDFKSALPIFGLINQLNEQELGQHFLITTRTAENILDDEKLPDNTIHQFLPIDLPDPVGAFIKYWHPCIVVIAEDEFYPNVLNNLKVTNVPTFSINTKITENSFRKWSWFPSICKAMFNTYELIMVQDNTVAKKLRKLGADDGKIRITGLLNNTKKTLDYDENLYSALSSSFGNRSIWLSAVTDKTEEDVVINAHKMAMRRNRRLLLILHTAQKGRGGHITERHENKNLSFALHENSEIPNDTTDVYISDDLDELSTYLRLASVTFCGGTLSSGKTLDPFHPASMGSAILHGPEIKQFEDDYKRYHGVNATRLVINGGQLANTLNEVIGPDVAAKMAHAAWEISSEGGEVSGIIISDILEKLANGKKTNAST